MKYSIEVLKISHSTATIEVEANSLEEAQEIALNVAENHEFDENSAEYDLAEVD